MIWALLAILGVPLWLVVGALGAALWNRSRVRSEPGAFPIRMRLVHGVPSESWGPKVTARWAHDVLIVHHGLGLARIDPYPVTSCAQAPRPDPSACKGLGETPVALSIGTDDGSAYEVATAVESADLLESPWSSPASGAENPLAGPGDPDEDPDALPMGPGGQ